MKGERWAYLDGVRGVAALTVAVFHCHGLFAASPFLSKGYLAVDMFFVLSGMVLEANYGERIRERVTCVLVFSVERLRRLLPMVWIGAAVVGLVNLTGFGSSDVSVNSFPALLRALLLMPTLITTGESGPGQDSAFPANGPLWSLFDELVVNFVWVVCLWRARGRSFLIIASMMIVGSAVAIAVHDGSLNFGWQSDAGEMGMGVVRAMGDFFIGTLLTRYRHYGLVRLERISWISGVALFEAFVVGCMLLAARAPGLCDSAVAIGSTLTLCFLREKAASGGVAYVMTWLGRISYPAYLLHAPIGRLFLGREAGWGTGGLFLGALVSAAVLAHVYVEVPSRSALS
ncbi:MULTISPECIES: acyltransferase [unclassified Burkholderia]|uniref:acyltransferase family protein n=1 Tax=unclassified Burkholderia TaxID=2613784 RepID=UPI002AB0753C|nr:MULTISPECIES: acyltransferase [unclassified Burkholderia]